MVAAGRSGQTVDRLNKCSPDLLITRTNVDGLRGKVQVLILGGLLDDERLQSREARKDLKSSLGPIPLRS